MQLGRRVEAVLLACIALFFVGCGGGGSASTVTSNSVPISLAMRDTPPSGVTVLSFEVTVTGAVLQPQSGGSLVSLLSSPVDVELSNLQTATGLINTSGAPAGTYQSIQVTFGNVEMTIQNNSGAAIGQCANGAVCELKPSVSPATVTYSGTPFPLSLSASSPTGLLLDFNLDQSIQSDLSISPSISFTQLQRSGEDQELDRLDDVSGRVTAVGSNQFTLQNASGQSYDIAVDSNTQYEDFSQSGCSTSNFACVAQNQNLEVSLGLMAGGSLLAKEVQLQDQSDEEDVTGVIVGIPGPTEFQMVVLGEIPDISGIQLGNPVTVTIQTGAQFQVDNSNNVYIPSTDSFSSETDLMVGQEVQVRRIANASSGTSITTDRITLKSSQITASVGAIQSSTSFTLDNLPDLFTNATPSVNTISVLTSSGTEFEEVTGVGGLSGGDKVSVEGLLFKTVTVPEVPDLIAEKVRKW